MAPSITKEEYKYIPPDLEDVQKFSKLKRSIIKPEDVDAVKASWKRLLVALEQMAEEIKSEGENYIPSVTWQAIKENNGNVPDDIAEKVKNRGTLIVRDVVDRNTCEEWRHSMEDFITKHPEIGGYPKPVQNWFCFWAAGEVKARSHQNVIDLMKSMGKLFYTDDENLPIDRDSSVVYPDAFRIRAPGEQTSLDLHLDAGSIERWEDDTYRELFAPILEGRWEEFEPWKLDERAFAKTDLYSHLTTRPTATSAFRALQGWLSLSDVKSGEGTLRVLPNIKLVNAYSILRPFFWRDDGEIDLETPKFPGAIVGSGQFFCVDDSHPHLKQLETVYSIPYANIGDYVFWHCDVAHEVDKMHNGDKNSSVFFNAYCPLCPYNIDNMISTREAFKQAIPPRDFIKDKNISTTYENSFEDHGARMENILTEDGLRGLGFAEFDINEPGLSKGQIDVRKMANRAMSR